MAFQGGSKDKKNEPEVAMIWQCPCGWRNYRHHQTCSKCGNFQAYEVKPQTKT